MGGFLHKPRKPSSDVVMTIESDDFDPEPLRKTFSVDITDTFLSKRSRIDIVGDFYNFGDGIHGIYALNDTAIVLVDYERETHTLRQRLVTIDHERKTATCQFYRGYSVVWDAAHRWSERIMCIGEGVMCIEGSLGGRAAGWLFPLNPLSTESHKSLAAIYAQAHIHIPQYNIGQGSLSKPFLISNTAIGFFAEVLIVGCRNTDLTRVLVWHCVLAKDHFSLPVLSSECHGTSVWNEPAEFKRCLLSAYHLDILSKRITVHAEVKRRGCKWTYKRWLILDTQTFRWAEIMVNKDRWSYRHNRSGDLTDAVQSFGNGLFSAATGSLVGASRTIGTSPVPQYGSGRLNLIRHPQRVPSLLYLARLAVQKHEMSQKVLEEFTHLLF